MLLKKTAKDSGGANFLVKKCGIPFCFLFHSLFHTLRAEHLIILLPPVCILHSTKTKKYRQKATKESIDTIMLLLYFCIHANMLMLPSCTCNMTTMEMDSHWHGFFPNSRVSLGSKSCTRMNGSVKAPLKGIEIPSPNKIQILLKKKKKSFFYLVLLLEGLQGYLHHDSIQTNFIYRYNKDGDQVLHFN